MMWAVAGFDYSGKTKGQQGLGKIRTWGSSKKITGESVKAVPGVCSCG